MCGSGDARRVAGRARVRFESAGHDVRSVLTRADRSPATQVREAIETGTDRVVAIGGDGTVTAVAEGVLASERPVAMAIVPQGTANVLALNLGIPDDRDRAIANVTAGWPVSIDVGIVNDEPFLISAATGSHAEMVAAANRRLKAWFGIVAYGLAWLKLGRRWLEPAAYTVTVDGTVHKVAATMVQVMNCGAVFRRRWEFAPGISPIDGRLDAIAYRASSVTEYVTAGAFLLRGAPTETELVEHWRGASIEIVADPPQRLQRDGELAGETPARIGVRPGALSIVVPASGPWVA